MHLPTPGESRRTWHQVLFTALMIAIVVATGFASMTHGHMPLAAGWHDAAPFGISGHDDGRTPCSICGVAHETSAGLLDTVDVVHDRPAIAHSAPEVGARSLAVRQCEQSPRAPPSVASY